MRAHRIGLGLALTGLAAGAAAQGTPLTVRFSLEQFFIAGKYFGEYITEDRFTRPSLTLESDNWRLEGTYWWYPVCHITELDETNLTYTSGKASFTFGRFRSPVGQSGWYDQWYSGFNYAALVEMANYDGHRFLWRTSVGARATYADGANTYEVAAVSDKTDLDRVAPSNFDRTQLKLQTYRDGVTYGLATVFDTEGLGRGEKMIAADVRWAVPQWIARGMVLGYSNDAQEIEGFFIDVYHRPKGWSDLTLLARHEKMETLTATTETTTLGTKLRGPWDTSVYVNYRFGPSMNTVAFGGPWSVGVFKTLRF